MSNWQSEREDYLMGGKSGGNGCLFLFLFFLFAIAMSWAMLYVSITHQLSK